MSVYSQGSASRRLTPQLALGLLLAAFLLACFGSTATATAVVGPVILQIRSLQQQSAADGGSFTTSNLRPVTPVPQQPSEQLPERFDSGSPLAAETIEISFRVPDARADDFQKNHQSKVASITGRLTGTPAASWQFRYGSASTNSSSPSSSNPQPASASTTSNSPSTSSRQPPSDSPTSNSPSTSSSQPPSASTTSNSPSTSSSQPPSASTTSNSPSTSSSQPPSVSTTSNSQSSASTQPPSAAATAPPAVASLMDSTRTSGGRRLMQEQQSMHDPTVLSGLPWQGSATGSADRKVLQQNPQQQSDASYLEVSLSLLALAPQLVVYRLVQPVEIDSPGSKDSCTTLYCSELVSGQVPLDSDSIAVLPDLGTLASRVSSASAPATSSGNQTARQQQQNIILGAAIGGGAGGLALLVLAVFVIRNCRKPKHNIPVIKKRSIDPDYTWQPGSAVHLSRDFSYQPEPHQFGVRASVEYPRPETASLSRTSTDATPGPVIGHQSSDADDRVSTVSEHSEATFTRSVSTATAGESTAASSAGTASGSVSDSASGSASGSAAKVAQANKSMIKLKFLKILSQNNSKSSSTSSSGRTSSAKQDSASPESDEPETPKASFFEDEDVANKVLKDLVPTTAKHQVVGGRVVFKLPHHRRVHSECSSPHFADSRMRASATRSPFGGMSALTTDASTNEVATAGPHAVRRMASAAATPLAMSPKAASSTGEALAPAFPQQSPGFRTPTRRPPSGYTRHRPGFMSTGVISQVNTPPLNPDPSKSEVDPVTLYHALHGYYESLKEVRQLLAAHETPGRSSAATPVMHSRAASSSSYYSVDALEV